MKLLLVTSVIWFSFFAQASDVNLSDENRKILESGPISSTRHIIGGTLSIYPGFGIGQVVEGRYLQTGWIFTVGESASGLVMLDGLVECSLKTAFSNNQACAGNGEILAGAAAFLGFKVWEIFDGWYGPHKQNLNYDRLKKETSAGVKIQPVILPTSNGCLAGLRLIF